MDAQRWEVTMAKVRSADRTGSGMYEVNEGWLRQHDEPVLEPDLPIVDPHHHLWDRDSRYLLDELLDDVDTGHNVRAQPSPMPDAAPVTTATLPAKSCIVPRNLSVTDWSGRKPRRRCHGTARASRPPTRPPRAA